MDAFHFLKENQIFTVEELEQQTHELSAVVDDLVALSKANTARIKQLDNMITFGKAAGKSSRLPISRKSTCIIPPSAS